MARTLSHTPRLAQEVHIDTSQRKQLEVEKLGVIAGFLVGLPLGLSLVQDNLLADGLPTWLAGGAAVATVVASTWLGLKAAASLAALFRDPA